MEWTQYKGMLSKLVLLLPLLISLVACEDTSFNFVGFQSANLSLDGMADITSTGILKLTNNTKRQTGHAFYPNPISFRNSSHGAVSFSTTFVFAIVSENATRSSDGLAFVIAPTRGLPGALPSQYLGLFNSSNIGYAANHIVAVELDTMIDFEFDDINNNHVGIDINGLASEKSLPAGYYAADDGDSGP